MPIPDYQSLMLPVLRFAGDRKEHSVADFRQRIASELKLSEQELSERLASDSQTVFANRIGWAVQYLKAAVTLKAVKRGVYQITDRGLALLKEKPSEITVKTLRQFSEFLEFHGKGTASDATAVIAAPSPEVKETPE
jgi:restriction system protein